MGIKGIISLILDNVSKPDNPGIFSSKKIISKLFSVALSMASDPFVTASTLYPFDSRNRICGFNNSISSSAHRILPCIWLIFNSFG